MKVELDNIWGKDLLISRRFNARQLASCCLLLTVVSFPLSSSLKSVFLTLTTLALLVQPEIRSNLIKVLKEPWCVILLLFFGLVIAGCFIGDADWKSKLSSTNRYSKLLYLPLLVLLFQDKWIRNASVHAFLVTMLVTLFASILKIFHWVSINSPGDPGAVFQNHIVTGYFMAFSAYIAALYSWQNKGKLRWGYGTLALLFSFHTLFINTGRTGYVSFAILAIVFLLQSVSLRKLPLYLCLLIPPLVFTLYQSPTFNHGVRVAIQDTKTFSTGNKNTSVGFRLQFSRYAKKLFYTSPVIGLGTASFSWHFAQDKPLPAWGDTLSDPHNQYWLTAVEYGISGLVVLMLFFSSIAWTSYKTRKLNSFMPGLLCSFLVANCADSFLLFSSTGYFFIIFSAILLGESLESTKMVSNQDDLQWAVAPC